MSSYYNDTFYNEQMKGSIDSSREIVPYIMSIIKPNSVIDVGCGIGTWLATFKSYGINDFTGIDGDYVNKNKLLIPQNQFIPCDIVKGIDIPRKFDLVVSLEVAEHLPTHYSEKFIEDLTKLGDVVFFSAAIPNQGGVNHINEQWQEYWAEIFSKFDYIAVDCIRPTFWNNQNVDFWYKQNSILYINKSVLNVNFLKFSD